MKRWTMCLLLGLLLLLGSCSTAAEKGGYQLYFASGLEDGSAILSEPYQGEADPGPRELMEALLSGPTEEELNSPFPSGVSLRSWGLEEGVLVLNLSEQYGGLTDISLTVADYCIVLTMSQLDGVEAVEINVAGQPVSYRNHQILTREEAGLTKRADPFNLNYIVPKSGAAAPERKKESEHESLSDRHQLPACGLPPRKRGATEFPHRPIHHLPL